MASSFVWKNRFKNSRFIIQVLIKGGLQKANKQSQINQHKNPTSKNLTNKQKGIPQETRRVECQLTFLKSKWQASLSFGPWPLKNKPANLIFWLTLMHGYGIDIDVDIAILASASVCMAQRKKLQVHSFVSLFVCFVSWTENLRERKVKLSLEEER